MSMHQGLDLSRFKKVSSDNKSTTLVHSKGHEIKIAHSGLTPKMREQLNGLPVHLAEGGDVKKEDDDPSAYVEPEVEDTSDPSGAESPKEPEAQPQTQLAEAAPEPAPETPQAQPEAAPAAPAQQSTAPAAPQPAAPSSPLGPKTAAQMADEMTAHDMAFQQDLAKGHIKPETYHDLYEKKDTLGKIGTLFGLLIGGAGSGLTHQPNAIMEMMNKQIQNDFEAQKASHESAQNWLRLSQQHEMQKAQIGQMGIQNELTKAQIGKIPSEIALSKAHAAQLKADTDLISQNSALVKMKLGAIQKLNDDVNKMPPGPQKDGAVGALNNLSAAVSDDVVKSNAQTAAQLEARQKLKGATGSWAQANNGQVSVGPAVDMDKFNLLAKQGQMNESMGLPGGMRGADVANATKESQEVADNRATAKVFDDTFRRLDQAKLAGKLNPNFRKAEMATLGAEVARATAGRFNANEATAQADGMFPSWNDYGQARDEKYRKAMEHFSANEAGTTTLDRFGLKTPFPFGSKRHKENVASSVEPKRHQAPKESAPETKMTGGKKYRRGPNGEAIEVK